MKQCLYSWKCTRKPPSQGHTGCYLFTVSKSGLLTVQCLLPPPTHFRHRHIPQLISGIAGKPACIEPAAGERLAAFVDHAQPAPVYRPFRASPSPTGPARHWHASVTDTFLNSCRVFIVVVIFLASVSACSSNPVTVLGGAASYLTLPHLSDFYHFLPRDAL